MWLDERDTRGRQTAGTSQEGKNGESRKDDETMTEDEIGRYTADSDVLDMMDFRDIPADELAGTEDYIDAQATVAEGIHDALRAAQWAKMYRGVRLDKADIDGLQALLDGLKE